MSRLGGVTDTGTVISNLPLLFADGYPTSLEKITEMQLNKFIPFMINCSFGRDPSCKDSIPTPEWWLDEIEFSIPLVKTPRLESKWRSLLTALITRCYEYHDCRFMLQFCSDLAKFPTSMLKFVDRCDGTTSLHNKETGKLLVTFRNENRAYDRKVDSPRKYLLPRGQRPLIVQPPLIDIYLCDNCDSEFETLKEVREHEQSCQQELPPACLRSSTPDDLLDVDQGRFLNYFGLLGDDSSTGLSSSPVRPTQYKRRCQGRVNFNRCYTVPFSSPLGLALQKKLPGKQYVVPQAHLERVERYCIPTKTNAKDVNYYPCKNRPKITYNGWVHQYSFNKKQKNARLLVIETGLNKRSRQLLQKCTKVIVLIHKLTEREIMQYTNGLISPISPCDTLRSSVSRVSEEIPVIDLCSTDDECSSTSNSIITNDSSNGGTVFNQLYTGDKAVQCLQFDSGCDKSSFDDLFKKESSPILPNSSEKISFGLNNTSTRTRWYGLPKSVLASENGKSNGHSKKYKKKIDKYCTSIHAETKSKLQEFNKIAETSSSPTKDWLFI